MPGLFYRLENENRFPITLLLVETLVVLGEHNPDSQYGDLIATAIKKAGVVDKKHKVTKEDVEYVVKRLEGMKKTEEPSEGESKQPERGLGTDFLGWLSDLDSEGLCLFIAGFDSFRAREIYRTWDREEVTKASQLLLHCEWQKLKASFEATMYGFGGGYKKEQPPGQEVWQEDENTTVFDLTAGGGSGIDAAKKAFSGH